MGDAPYYHQLPDVRGSAPALRRCHVCGRSQDIDSTVQLRKCGGCSRALYCSKACQKAAWPRHKVICRDIDGMVASLIQTHTGPGKQPTDFSSFGYRSFPAFTDALQEFTEAHNWAFKAVAKALVLNNGGIDWSQNPQQVLSLLLAPTATAGTRERNPARTFRFTSYLFTPLAEELASSPHGYDQWAKGEPLRKEAEDLWHGRPGYAGLLLVKFAVKGLNVSFMVYYPQFRPVHPPGPPPLLADDNTKKALVHEVMMLCGSSITAGVPLCQVEGYGPQGMNLALPGRFVRGPSASWTWTALLSSWADYRRGAHRLLDDMFDMANIHNAPADILIAFNLL